AANYSGSANFNTSSGSLSGDQTVNMAGTTTTLASSTNPSQFAQSVTLTATVNPVTPGAGTRTGTVTFNVDGTDQAPASVNAAGQATLSTSALAIGNHPVIATYNGDGNFTVSASTVFTQTVTTATTTTTISSSAN